MARGLALVCAPAGYGKTVLLADWARRTRHPARWLSLDTADNDPARFWRYVVAALDRACPGIGARVGPYSARPCRHRSSRRWPRRSTSWLPGPGAACPASPIASSAWRGCPWPAGSTPASPGPRTAAARRTGQETSTEDAISASPVTSGWLAASCSPGDAAHPVPDHEHRRMPGLQIFQRLFRRPQLVRAVGALKVFRCRAVPGHDGARHVEPRVLQGLCRVPQETGELVNPCRHKTPMPTADRTASPVGSAG